MRLLHLLLCQLRVSRELPDLNTKRLQSSTERSGHLSGQSLHRRNVDNLKVRSVSQLAVLDVLTDLVKYGHHRDVGLARSSRCTHQQVLVRVICCLVDPALDTVQRFHSGKGGLRPVIELLDWNESLVLTDRRALTRGHVNLLVPIVHLARGPRGQSLFPAAAAAAETVQTRPDIVLGARLVRCRLPVPLAERRETHAGVGEPLEQRLALPLRDSPPNLPLLLPSKFFHLDVRRRLDRDLRHGSVLPRAPAPVAVAARAPQSLAQRADPPSQRGVDRRASFDRARDCLHAAVAEKVEELRGDLVVRPGLRREQRPGQLLRRLFPPVRARDRHAPLLEPRQLRRRRRLSRGN